jgi:hypothetical protein
MRGLARLSSLVIAAHRVWLLAGTVLVAVATTRLTGASSHAHDWLVLMGGAGLMYVADVFRRVDSDAHELVRNAGPEAPDIHRARTKIESRKTYVGFALAWVAAVALALLGLILAATAPGSVSRERPCTTHHHVHRR